MLLSKTCEYGVRAMLYLSGQSSDKYVSVRTISKELDISFHFLTKIFQQLTGAGLLQSYRGPNGGVKLAKQAAHITLKEVYVAIEGPDMFTDCVLGLPECGVRKPCPLHASWSIARDELSQMLEGRNLGEIGEDIAAGNLRL